MPHLVKWNEELGPFGLTVIAVHGQNGPTPEQVEAKAKALGIRFSVPKSIGIVGGGGAISLPHCFLFDNTGRLLYEGRPDKAELKLRLAVGQSVVDRTGKKSFNKTVQPLVDSLTKGVSPTLVLGRTIPLYKKDEDAKVLMEALTRFGKEQFEEISEKVDSDPVGAYTTSKLLSGVFKGTPVGISAGTLFTKLKNDKSVLAEVKAQPLLEKVLKLDAYIEKTVKDKSIKDFDPMAMEIKKSFDMQLKQIRSIALEMKAAAPQAQATLEAVGIAEKYGIKLK